MGIFVFACFQNSDNEMSDHWTDELRTSVWHLLVYGNLTSTWSMKELGILPYYLFKYMSLCWNVFIDYSVTVSMFVQNVFLILMLRLAY